MMKRLRIDAEKCTGCGTCLAFSDYIAEGSDGKARVKHSGKIEDPKVLAADQEMVELCPEQAIELRDIQATSLRDVGTQAIVEQLKKALSSIEIPGPTSSDYDFDKEKYAFDIDYDYLDGTHYYEYKSSSAARDAAWNEFYRRNYGRIEQYAMEVLSQYGAYKIAPFFDGSEQGMYAKWNKQFEAILQDTADRVADALGDRDLPEDFCTWNVLPTQYIDCFKDYNPIKWGSKVDRKMRQDPYANEAWYKRCIDTDEMERVEAGRIFKGVLHNVTRYCYDYDIGMGGDFKKDILDTIYLMDMDEYYEEVLGWIIDDYRKNVEKMIASKCEALEAALG